MAFELFDLTGRRALITGSSQGIGFALAQGLAEHCAKVVLNGRDAGNPNAAAARLAAASRSIGSARGQGGRGGDRAEARDRRVRSNCGKCLPRRVSTFAASGVPLSAGYAAPSLDLPHAMQSLTREH